MVGLAHLAAAELLIALALVYGAVAYQLITRAINLAGLLNDKTTGDIDPGRIQALVVTLFVAAALFSNLGEVSATHRIALPSGWLLGTLGGSHGFYLVGKFMQCRAAQDRRDR
jgi:hypothetical protein